MTELVFIKHKFLSVEFLNIICALKSNAWNYSINEQKKWINKNLKSEDTHVLLLKDGEYVAYLNLIETNVLCQEGKLIDVLGIGNVCAKTKGMGYGSSLMEFLNDYLVINKIRAILLCKNELIKFYSKLGYNLNFKLHDNIYLMSLNIGETKFKFEGETF